MVAVHTFNPNTQETEAGRSLEFKAPRSTKQVPGQPGLHGKTLSWKRESWTMGTHTCNARTWEVQVENQKFKASLGYMRPLLKNK